MTEVRISVNTELLITVIIPRMGLNKKQKSPACGKDPVCGFCFIKGACVDWNKNLEGSSFLFTDCLSAPCG